MPPTITISGSELPGSVFSQALTQAEQQVNHAASQGDTGSKSKSIDWSKIWDNILTALKQAGCLLVEWCDTVLSWVLFALTQLDDGSIGHPRVLRKTFKLSPHIDIHLVIHPNN
ncbi:hypothetical protein BD769DRAFT_1383727 [Suillus cothurnatus]|nr:hypothetical protein BD769DRAFT_1383727 [Suillus cothurnatus]